MDVRAERRDRAGNTEIGAKIAVLPQCNIGPEGKRIGQDDGGLAACEIIGVEQGPALNVTVPVPRAALSVTCTLPALMVVPPV